LLLLAGPAWAQSATSGTTNDNVVSFINQQLRQSWSDNEVTPSPAATDGEWVRRVYLDLLGRVPSLKETRAFLADKDETKRAKLVDRLLESEDYELEFANYWSTIWTNLLIGRNGGNDDDRPVSREGLEKFVRDAFLRRMPFDKFVSELIAANGNNTPGEKNFNGATNFLLDNLQEDQVPATNKVSQIFLGLRVGCTQCHNHPFNEWKQDQFWSMNAFFKQAKPLRTFEGREIVSARLEDEDFAGQDNNPEEAAIFYELRNGLLKVAYPRFVDGTDINPAGYVSDVNRRDELAKLVVASPYMREAAVNRLWGHFFGYGFTKPVDDMGPHNPPSHPELLTYLGGEFAQYGFDMRKAMRWMVLSDAYALSSKITAGNKSDDPAKGTIPLFTRFYTRQMSAEQLYASLMIVTQVDQTASTIEEQNRIRNQWLQQFTVSFGNDENTEATTFNGTIPQALMMMNGQEIQQATSVKPGSFLHTLSSSGGSPAERINAMFLSALSRSPSNSETQIANQLVAARGGDTMAALQDVFWAILNSNEFIIVH
jgi:hypothetical protein